MTKIIEFSRSPKEGKYDQCGLFRQLSPEEEQTFREYAEQNDPPDMAKWDIYHPVCRQVWEARGISPHDEQQQVPKPHLMPPCPALTEEQRNAITHAWNG